MFRAYSILNVKSVDEGRRIVTGTASTPTPDRERDVLMPMGAQFKTPMPLLLYHNVQKPVGTVDFAKATKTGIPFEASLPNVVEEGTVKERVEEAWHSIKYKLLAAVSVGFLPIEGGVERLKSGGLQFNSWNWLELTLCAIPQNPEALIHGFKSMDVAEIRRVLGTHPSDSDAERQKLIKSLDTAMRAASGASHRGGVKLISTPASRETKTAALRGSVKLIPRTYENCKRADQGSGKHPCGESRAND